MLTLCPDIVLSILCLAHLILVRAQRRILFLVHFILVRAQRRVLFAI